MDVRLSRTEMVKIVKRHIPNIKYVKWDGKEVVVGVDSLKLRNIDKKNRIYLSEKVNVKKAEYIVSPVIYKKKEKYVAVIQ